MTRILVTRASLIRLLGWHLLVYGAMLVSALVAMRVITLPPNNVTAIWLPGGIAVAALLSAAGWSVVPTIWLAHWTVMVIANDRAFFSWYPGSWLVCAINTVGPALAVLAWRRFLRGNPFADGGQYLKFVGLVAVAPAVLTAWGVIAVIYAEGFLPGVTWEQFLMRCAIITVSDALGVFLVLPLVMAPRGCGLVPPGAGRWWVQVASLAAMVLVCSLGVGVSAPLIYGAIPLALVAAVLCGPRAVAAQVLVVCAFGLAQTARGEGPFHLAGGGPLAPVLAMSAFAFGLGLPGQFAGITFDQLRRHRRELETTVRLRTEALEKAKLAAEAADQAKSRFLASMSHEIRTPMNGVLGFARLMEDTPLDARQREYMDAILRSGETLLGLIDDILDFSKVEAGAVVLEQRPFEVRGMLEGAVRMLEPLAAQKGLKLKRGFDPGLPAWGLGDARRLGQVVANLVGNAIKFTERGEVEVWASAAQRGEGWELQVAVRDTGIGITSEQMERLFQPFSQADGSITRRYGGTGLGLVISRRLCERMGGTLSATSEPGRGSRFLATFGLGVAGAPGVAAGGPLASGPGAPVGGRRLRVLVAEDNAVNRKLISAVLEKMGHECVFAHDGREAVERSGAERFDLVLMDVQMPVMDGLEATRLIREREAKGGEGRLKIVAVTADVMAGNRAACIEAGMDDFMVKPIQIDRVRALMARVGAG